MSFSIDHLLNGNLSTIVEYLNDGPIVENFLGAANIGNKTTTLTETQVSNLTEATKDIDQSMVTNNAAKLIKSVINNVVSNNQSSLLQALAASNNISISGGRFAGDLNLTNIKQQNRIDLTANIDVAQKVQNDITSKITDEVTQEIKKATTAATLTATSTDIGETFGKAMDAVSAIGTSFMDNAGKVIDGALNANMGNKTKTETKTATENSLKDAFNLNDSFTITTNEEFNNAVSNQLSSENLANCAQEAQANNNLDLTNVEVGGNANINNIEQSNFVTAALECAFNQDVCNKLAAIFITNYQNLIDNMIENTNTDNSGDILAVGVAGSAMIGAAGEAVSVAAQGAGSGFSEAAQGVGSGAGNVLGAFGSALAMNPVSIISCCFVLIAAIAAGAYYMMRKNKNSPCRA